jgi:hypothetical protein
MGYVYRREVDTFECSFCLDDHAKGIERDPAEEEGVRQLDRANRPDIGPVWQASSVSLSIEVIHALPPLANNNYP